MTRNHWPWLPIAKGALTRIRTIAFAAGVALSASAAAATDFVLSVEGHDMREYYCQTMINLENRTEAPLLEISGHLFLYQGGERVGRSKGTWFMNVAAGETATATFEAPNAPCKEADRVEFVVGACRIEGPGFDDKATCAARIEGRAPIVAVSAGS